MFFVLKVKHIICILLLFIFISAGISAGVIGAFKDGEKEAVPLPILMYHHILKDEARQGDYVISPDEFEEDLKFIKKNGYTAIVVEDLINFTKNKIPLPEKPIMITFDDGYLSTLHYAYPLLLKYEMKAVVSVIAKESEIYSKNGDRRIPYAHLSWEDLKQISESGVFEVQNHTYDMHKNKKGERCGAKKVYGESAEHYKAELKKDVGLAQDMLLKNADIKATCFTYPFGMISDESLDVIREMGFLASLSCFEGINFITDEPDSLYLLKRYNRAHKRNAAKILTK